MQPRLPKPRLDLATGRLHQVEHESLVTLLAERASVHAPVVRVAGPVNSGDALLVMTQPDGPSAEDADTLLTDEFLSALWSQAAQLRPVRIAHGALNLSNVLATPSGPMIVSFQRGQIAAAAQMLDVDVAELLVATSIAAGAERALKAALDAVTARMNEAAGGADGCRGRDDGRRRSRVRLSGVDARDRTRVTHWFDARPG